uniref:Uncharacterized protein n=1 Tax=Mycena chlorophos TaxID=658473 RepID=A0ABQ0LID1_MYCCL|nr:predicted protein [Mycena chlorophos]
MLTNGMETPIEGNPRWPWTHDVDCPQALPYQTLASPPERLNQLVSTNTHFFKGPFPRLVVTTMQLFQNLSERQTTMVCNNYKDTLPVIPHGAGTLFYQHNPRAAEHILDFLITLGFQGDRTSL